jgi:hypothetical protein
MTQGAMTTCSGCHLGEPNYFCWENRDWDCPLNMPPRWANESQGTFRLWKEVRRLREAT